MRIYDIWPLSRLKERSIILSINLLSTRDQVRLIVVTLITLFLAILDLFGVLLIGVIGSLSITGISTGQAGERVSIVLRLFSLDKLDFELQVILVGLMAAFLLLSKTLLSFILVRSTLYFMARRAAVISSDLVKRYFTIPVSKLNQRSAQTSIYALTTGVNSIMVGVIGVSVALISDIALLTVMSVGLFLVDPISTFGATFIFGYVAFFLHRNMHKKMQKIGEQQGSLQIESSERIFEAINSYRELIVRDRRRYYAEEIGHLRLKLADGIATMGFMGNVSKYVLEVTLVISALLLAFYQFSTGTAFRAIATIAIFVAASTRIIPAILRLQQGILKMRGELAQAKPTVALIRELSEIPLRANPIKSFTRDHSGFIPEVQASEITFSYENNRHTLKKISFKTYPGEFVAIVGGSGAGKTTLIDVLIGALDAEEGNVEISGFHPLTTFSTWPGAVSYVPQDSIVINGTIKDNLSLGFASHEISEKHFWDSLRLAHLDNFVKSLPEQLDAFVGDRGTKLSGGQKQRLGIARALITNPKLLILDEATSSLDGKTEHEISEDLRSLKGTVTLIVIAHRLSTIVNADRIYFIEAGLVKGVGTFSELKSAHPEFLEQANLMGL